MHEVHRLVAVVNEYRRGPRQHIVRVKIGDGEVVRLDATQIKLRVE